MASSQGTQNLISSVPGNETVPQAEIVWSYSSENYIEQERAREKKPVYVRTHPLTLAGRFDTKPSTVILPGGVVEATSKDLKHHSSNKHFLAVLEQVAASVPTKGMPLPKILEVPPSRNSPWVAALLPVQYARSLTVCTETVRRLGTEWVGDVKSVLELGSDGAGLLAWKSIAAAVEEGNFDRGKDGLLRGKEAEDAKSKKAKTYEELRYEEGIEEAEDVDALEKEIAALKEKVEAVEASEEAVVSERTAEEVNKFVAEVTETPEQVSESVESSADAEGAAVEGIEALVEGEEPMAEEEAAVEEPEEEYVPSGVDLYEAKFESSLLTKSTVASHQIRLHLPNTTIIDKIPEEASPKRFDLIIAHDICVPLKDDTVRLRQKIQRLNQLLTPNGVLVLIGEGSSRGFLAMNTARDVQITKRKPLEHYDSAAASADKSATSQSEETTEERKPLARVIAPCMNNEKCPLADTRLSRKGNNCLFTTRFQYPNYIQRILPPHAARYNYEDSAFSYLVTTPYNSNLESSLSTFPRVINRPLKRQKHIILDVCTPNAKIERWTVPKSFGRHEYHDARKTRWGDIWCLGAKTKKPRNMKVKRSMKNKKPEDLKEEDKEYWAEGAEEARAMDKAVKELEEGKHLDSNF